MSFSHSRFVVRPYKELRLTENVEAKSMGSIYILAD